MQHQLRVLRGDHRLEIQLETLLTQSLIQQSMPSVMVVTDLRHQTLIDARPILLALPFGLRECLIAFAILLLFMVFGNRFMSALGLSDVSLQIGGGVILFLIALRMVFPVPDGIFGASPLGEPFIVPLAIPAIAGPSALATVLLLVSREPERLLTWIGALSIALATSAVVLVFADRLQRRLGERVVIAFERLMGLVLIAIAVEMILKGVRAFILQL